MPKAPLSWTARVWAEFHAGNLTRAYRDVLLTLHTYRGPGGIAWPSHETLAARVGCSVRTVARALAQARRLDLVEWTERRVRAGWRWLRTSNAYRLLSPLAAVTPGLRPAWNRRAATTGHSDCGEERQENKKVLLARMLAEAARLPDLLALRRTALEGRLRPVIG